ncbi:YgiW/YdeI family stress tolerance OB fold protein [Pectobacterium quasiaquaticum]|uniref:YgiW/YdeI family stress tolerance OB fold protein n=1 Tax=Pectobacterium quasiaquaticum TaxID=2774015 RepID=A0A9Q2EVP2_9GAMM|nr:MULTISPECIES: NirD/YgiW/YdeI family stress tolerance protein [Pectobacterium]MBE5203380.1 YgiW/YdeI family stress tolerance OB fold protein [Pectobacterium quasiaquaticum]MBE5211426.1 YgiW/YdeI family stress tolerance OB fold protein [Pectobacterium quasiaquaticum]MBE5214529.1 YgiW/YdeI family stress tolerance OB fold protein [Pectobacterium quasiaquaticum]MBE5222612.1 YgiW/YdeI family stress tolerance OB fold protein [Pectobacterium quasiaquaticum]MBE5226742.1 YgiW/YdeI family stress toler
MKKAAALLAITALVSVPVFAAQSGGGFVNPETPAVGTHKGGFIDQQSSLTTVDKAKDLRDDSWVALSGNIEKRIGDENYLFRDSTGTMEVEIDHKRWNGQMVSPTDKVEIQGELDKDFNSVELDVKQIRKL